MEQDLALKIMRLRSRTKQRCREHVHEVRAERCSSLYPTKEEPGREANRLFRKKREQTQKKPNSLEEKSIKNDEV